MYRLFLLGSLAAGWSAALAEDPANPAQLYQTDKVWELHLKFSAEEWKAMQVPESDRNPGGPGGGGPRRFGPGGFLGGRFFAEGDADKDGRLTRAENSALSARLFAAWDQDKNATLSADELRAGSQALFAPPGANPGGANPGDVRPFGPMEHDFPSAHADLQFGAAMLKDVAVRYKGNNTFMASQGSLKRPFKIDLDKFIDQSFAGVHEINLQNAVNDPGWMNETLSYQLYRAASVPASRTTYARVYLTVAGQYEDQYLGLYTLAENVDKIFLRERFGTDQGALFKPALPDLFSDQGDKWKDYEKSYDPKKVSDHAAQRVIDFARLVAHAGDAEFAARVGDYLDLAETARYFAVTAWLSTMDSILSLGHNYYLYLDPHTDKFQLIPWDLDHSFGQFMGRDSNATLDIYHPWQGQKRFLERLFKVDAWRRLYLADLREFSATIFQPERIIAQIDALAPILRPAIAEESKEKLARFDQAVAGQSPAPSKSEPAPPENRGPRSPAAPVRSFVVARDISVRRQLEAGPTVESAAAETSGRSGPPGFGGPGDMMGRLFQADANGAVSRDTFLSTFDHWFQAANPAQAGSVDQPAYEAALGAGLPGRPEDQGRPAGPPPNPAP